MTYTAADLAAELRREGDEKITERIVRDYVARRIISPAESKTLRFTDSHLARLKAARVLVRGGKSLEAVKAELDHLDDSATFVLAGYLRTASVSADTYLQSSRLAYATPADLEPSMLRSAPPSQFVMPQNSLGNPKHFGASTQSFSANCMGALGDTSGVTVPDAAAPSPSMPPSSYAYVTPLMGGAEIRTAKPLPPDAQAAIRQVLQYLLKPHLA